MAGSFEPVPTYAEVSYTFKDKKGNLKTAFNPTWLKWFIDLQSHTTGAVNLATDVTGILPAVNGGYGVAVPVTPVAAAFSAGVGTNVTNDATFGGYTIGDIVNALQQIGVLA